MKIHVLLVRKANNTEPLDETNPVLKTFILGLENLLSLKVKVIRCDNGTEFKNSDLNQFYGLKGIKREFSVPRTPQQNGIAERKNRTLIKASRTLLADLLFPILFWAEAVNTACYVQNSVKAFRVFNSRTRIVQETLHVYFMENKPNVVGSGPAWLFDIDSLTRTMNYHPVITENHTNSHAGLQDTEKAREEVTHTYVLFLVLTDGSTNSQNKNKDALVNGKEHDDDIQNTNDFSAAGPSNTAASLSVANSSSQDASTSSHDSNIEPLLKDSDGEDVDVHTYSQENLSILKGKALLGLMVSKGFTFDLVAYSDSDYAGASLDRKSTTGGCQFFGCRLISWQCKKQTVVATSSTK
nr:ribonuclease H-like domain-containing protein [Tanacetum cinerariifolium]